jgi:surface protein
MCPNATVGEMGRVNRVGYTKRTRDQITPENASTTCTSGITDMSLLFKDKYYFNGNISSWDVSNVTNMESMFYTDIYYQSKFNQPIGNWDVSNVTNMDGMFYNAKSFNQNISNWCVQKITTIPKSFSAYYYLSLDNSPLWGRTCNYLSSPEFDELTSSIMVYPNPINTHVNLYLPDYVQLKQTEVINALGQTVHVSNDPELQLHHLQSGVYYLKISTDNGVVYKKVIKN